MVPVVLRCNKWIVRGDPTQVSDVLAAGKIGEEGASGCPPMLRVCAFLVCFIIFVFLNGYFKGGAA